ncbi:MAG: hypothetical protein A2X59_00415 [Nitrospirae bacterium GWC2_42_7]|nr:MAG: hypothetical protein A2X59_00415 [Nitrospirae bacterium GWC2_42_7]
MSRVFFFLILILLHLSIAYAGPALVTDNDNRHNLSMYSSSSIKATNEKQICIFCHTPHNSSSDAPLWNHLITTETNYTHYWTATLNAYSSAASAPEIDGYSRVCLSCHDGTVALGAVKSRITTYGEGTTKIQMNFVSGVVDASGKLIGGTGYVGTDLSGDHPISFEYNSALAAADGFLTVPQSGGYLGDSDVKLYPTGADLSKYGVQCTSCHDPHDDSKNSDIPFWRKATYEEVCDVCHTI